MMLEYNMVDENSVVENYFNEIYSAKLKDNHTSLLSPTYYEVEQYTTQEGSVRYKKKVDPISLNTINHFAVPQDHTCSISYMFLDSDYSYVSESNYERLDDTDIKVNEYSNFITPNENGNTFTHYNNIPMLRSDRVRLYFVNGYDFSNIYGILMRVSLDKMENGVLDLCNFVITRNNAYSLISYLTSPIIFGDDVYDRYIEINLPAVYDIMYHEQNHDFYRDMAVKDNQTLKLQFSYIMDDDIQVKNINIPLTQIIRGSAAARPVNGFFTKDSTLKGTIPVNAINSDNLGVYISECPDLPYIEFYATWKDEPLTKDIVWKFNKGIVLYDKSLVRGVVNYEVSDDYSPEYNMRKWVAMHEIKCNFCKDDKVLKEETYSMSQIFVNDMDQVKFYYRPLIFDEQLCTEVNVIQVVYTMRFVNVDDKVQFVKIGTISLYDNMSKYYAKGSTLRISDTKPFRIYNKIVDNVQSLPVNGANISNNQQTKYVKVYYDTSNITLYDNGANYVPYTYTLNMSQVPKVYKFIFRKSVSGGKYSYMDLTNGYYKLMFRDSAGNTITIDPTHSSNMNMYLGELEFEINAANVNRLMNVNYNDRKMSIISYGDNGYMSSLYDFMYNI